MKRNTDRHTDSHRIVRHNQPVNVVVLTPHLHSGWPKSVCPSRCAITASLSLVTDHRLNQFIRRLDRSFGAHCSQLAYFTLFIRGLHSGFGNVASVILQRSAVTNDRREERIIVVVVVLQENHPFECNMHSLNNSQHTLNGNL